MSPKTFAMKKSFLSSSENSNPDETALAITGKPIRNALKTGTKFELKAKIARRMNETTGTERITARGKLKNALKDGKIPDKMPAALPKTRIRKKPDKTRRKENPAPLQNESFVQSEKSRASVAVKAGKIIGFATISAAICQRRARTAAESKWSRGDFIFL